MQKPSKGRIVIAQVSTEGNNGADTCPAVVTRVWGERPDGSWTINVKALKDGPVDEWKTSVILFETEQDARAYGLGSCFWPPRA
jgi:subtilisin-like proprotein convertase family protein